ncbi:MAG: phosphoribosyltransferase family protein [Oligoflexia bacterium]|nr:phosphoribosyltransferase family protein [Oligoflexia bacterium]
MKQTIVFLKEEDIQKLVRGLAQQINHDYKSEKEPLCLVCLLKGSLFFFSDLVRQLENSILIDFVSIASSNGNCALAKDINMAIKGRHVLIVKEILNEGNRLLFLKKRIEAGYPKSVKIVTLIDKPSQRKLTLHPDYFGLSTEDRYIFGYGLDHQEQYRQLRDMYLFAQ